MEHEKQSHERNYQCSQCSTIKLQFQARIQKSQKQLEKYKKQNSYYRTELNQLRRKLSLNPQFSQYDSQINHNEQKEQVIIGQIKHNLDKMDMETKDLKRQMSQHQTQIEKYKSQINQFRDDFNKQGLIIRNQNNTINELKNQINRLKDMKDQAEADKMQTSRQLSKHLDYGSKELNQQRCALNIRYEEQQNDIQQKKNQENSSVKNKQKEIKQKKKKENKEFNPLFQKINDKIFLKTFDIVAKKVIPDEHLIQKIQSRKLGNNLEIQSQTIDNNEFNEPTNEAQAPLQNENDEDILFN